MPRTPLPLNFNSLCYCSFGFHFFSLCRLYSIYMCITFITRRFACVRLFIYCLICVWEAFFSRLSAKRLSFRHVGVFCERVFVPAYRVSFHIISYMYVHSQIICIQSTYGECNNDITRRKFSIKSFKMLENL